MLILRWNPYSTQNATRWSAKPASNLQIETGRKCVNALAYRCSFCITALVY